jgi:EmrB/QacA subfamily drug resistance transporter
MLAVDVPDASTSRVDEQTKWLAQVLILVVGLFMAILDVTIVNVAVPAIQYDFGGNLDDVLWIVTAYTMTLGVVVPLSSWLGDRIGLTRLFVGSLVGFSVCSGMCGLAWNLDVLIAFRVLQAIPGGVLPVVIMTMIYRLVPTRSIGVAMGIYGLGGVSAPAVGPVLGGYLVQYFSWRLVFDINVPIGLLTAGAALLAVRKLPRVPVHRFDFLGFVTIALGMSAILLAASEGGQWGWSGYRIRMLFVFGALLLALFVVIVLALGQLTYTVVATGVLFLNLLLGVFYVPVFLQQGQGLGAFAAGLVMIPSALVMCFTVPASGLLYERFGPRVLGVLGIVVLVIGDFLMSGLNPDATQAEIVFWTWTRGLGMGIATVPIMTWGLSSVPAEQTNHASALNNASQQVTGALGMAVLATLITTEQAQLAADRAALLGPTSELARLAGPLLPKDPSHWTATTFAAGYQLAAYFQVLTGCTAYGDMFVTIGLVTLGLIPLVLLLRPRAPRPPAEPTPLEEPATTQATGEPALAPSPPADVPSPRPEPVPGLATATASR